MSDGFFPGGSAIDCAEDRHWIICHSVSPLSVMSDDFVTASSGRSKGRASSSPAIEAHRHPPPATEDDGGRAFAKTARGESVENDDERRPRVQQPQVRRVVSPEGGAGLSFLLLSAASSGLVCYAVLHLSIPFALTATASFSLAALASTRLVPWTREWIFRRVFSRSPFDIG